MPKTSIKLSNRKLVVMPEELLHDQLTDADLSNNLIESVV